MSESRKEYHLAEEYGDTFIVIQDLPYESLEDATASGHALLRDFGADIPIPSIWIVNQKFEKVIEVE